MLTALKGNIIEALSPDILGIHPSSYLVLEDGRVEGIYPTLPENMAETADTMTTSGTTARFAAAIISS